MLPKDRLRVLNDPAQSQVAGKFKQALMPAGPGGSHATVGWMRFYGMTPHAVATPVRAEQTATLINWFGGKVDGGYCLRKTVLRDLALKFGIKSLYDDPEIRSAPTAYGGPDLMARQRALARKKDAIAL